MVCKKHIKHIISTPFFDPIIDFISLGVGSNSFGFGNSGFTANDLFVPNSSDSLVISPGNAISKMARLNFLEMNMQNEIFGFGFQTKSVTSLFLPFTNSMCNSLILKIYSSCFLKGMDKIS